MTEEKLAAMTAEMKHLKAYFPYRIVFAIVENGEYEVQARVTKHVMNKAQREGKTVYILGS